LSTWKLVKKWKEKPQGQVWIVQDNKARVGYFKYADPKQWYFSGPMIANELISAALARKLGLPVARLELTEIIDTGGTKKRGIVSIKKSAQEVITWAEANQEIKQNPVKYLNQVHLLRSLVVFDAWIANIDRSVGKNLILHRNQVDDKYNWYLIDHGNCLYGSPRRWKKTSWNSPYWSKIWLFSHVPKGFMKLKYNRRLLNPMIKKIENLRISDIEAAISSVPTRYLDYRKRKFIRRLLMSRKQQIRKMIYSWIKFNGIKEYGSG
jgi:hypothetical protein